MTLAAYLSFRDNARQALEFYHGALGGELRIDTFDTFPDMVQNPDEASLVMHGQLTLADGAVLMASDTPSTMPYAAPQGISVAFTSAEESTLRAAWSALGEGGRVSMPFDAAPWGGWFGMLTDRFGIAWMFASDSE